MPKSQNKTSVFVSNLRKRAGLTQADLAKKSGISFRTMQRIESGEVSPRIDLFLRIIRNTNSDVTRELFEIFKEEEPTAATHSYSGSMSVAEPK